MIPVSVKKSIKKIVNRPVLKRSRKIIIGAGSTKQNGWASCDIEEVNITNIHDFSRYWDQENLDCFLAEHVWEHLFLEEGRAAAANCFAFLKPGGRLRIAVPDGNSPDPKYIENVRVGGSGLGAHDHKVLYTAESLSELLESAGFKAHPVEYYDKSGKFNQLPWSEDYGHIRRSRDHDSRNDSKTIRYTSLIVDGIKPANEV